MESSCQLQQVAPVPRRRPPRRPRPARATVRIGARLAAPPRPRPGLGAAGLAASVAVHLGLLALLLTAGRAPVAPPVATPVEIEVIQKAPPPPPPPEPVEEKKPEPARKVALAPRKAPPAAKPPPPKAEQPVEPPPPNDAPPPDAKPRAPVMIGISMSSTTAGGGFAAPVGNTLYGEAPKQAPRPEEVQPYAAPVGRYVPPYKVTRLPEIAVEAKAVYPEEARKLGLEGQVVLRLTVDAQGQVSRAAVVRGAGHGFDAAALAAIRKFRFKPGLENGEAVATDITYTYTFILD